MTDDPGDAPAPHDPAGDGRDEPGHRQYQVPPGPPQQQTGGYGYPAGPYPPQDFVRYAPDHPRSTTILVLGILGVVLCQVLGPFAWVMGRRALTEIDASHGRLGGRGAVQAGYVLGIIGTVLLAVTGLILVAYLVFAIVFIGGGIATSV